MLMYIVTDYMKTSNENFKVAKNVSKNEKMLCMLIISNY
jgi:hypothetical protein